MSRTGSLALAIVCIIILYMLYEFSSTSTSAHEVISQIDGRRYRVQTSYEEFEHAADMFATLHARITRLLQYLQGQQSDDLQRQQIIAQLIARYKPTNLVENSPPKTSGGDTSYTLNKGAEIAICLRDRETDQFHDLEILTFVILHEMTHIAIEEVEHPARFWAAFRYILEEAENGGIYTSPRYADIPQKYCGLMVNYNPRYDPWVVAI